MTNLWRPFAVPGAANPMRIRKGDGSVVADTDGREYLDAAGGLWNVSLGLANGELIERMHEQLRTLSFSSLFHTTNAPAELLCERLLALTGGAMRMAYLSTTGSSAVEVALRVARLHHAASGRPDKRRILSFDIGYHGCSGLGVCASGILAGEYTRYEQLLPDFQAIPSPVDEAASLAALGKVLHEEAGQVACLIMEPIVGSGGIIVPSPGYCREVSRLCRAHGVLLVADEVATGGGRCGAMLASPLLGLEPDIVTLSKGINSGYFPLGATLFSSAVVEPIRARGIPFQYGSTQDGNPVGCVAALATLDQIERHGLDARARELGARIQEALRDNPATPVVREVRGLGLMIGIELAHLGAGGKPFSPAESGEVRHLCQDAGLLVYHFDSGISLFPALTMSDAEADSMVDIIGEVLATLV